MDHCLGETVNLLTPRYADLEHAVAKVTSGYRLVLTYNLIQTGAGPSLSASSLGDSRKQLSQTLSLWSSNLESSELAMPTMLAYMLRHKYTDANLRLSNLKGKDRHIANAIQAACEDSGFKFYLANLQRTVEGGCTEMFFDDNDWGYGVGGGDAGLDSDGLSDYHDIEPDETTLELKKVVDADGTKIVEKLITEETDIVQEDPFDGRNPDKEETSGYTGNEGVSATRFYRNSCIVVVPRSRQMSFIFPSLKYNDQDLANWMLGLLDDKRLNPSAEMVRDLANLCFEVIQFQEEHNC